jgi:hypothetical protein
MFVLIMIVRRQGLALGATTCANCTAGFFCAAGSLNVFGGTNTSGMHKRIDSKWQSFVRNVPIILSTFFNLHRDVIVFAHSSFPSSRRRG